MGAKDAVYVPQDVPAELDKPKFDFSNVSFEEGRNATRIKIRLQHLQSRIDGVSKDDDVEGLISDYDILMDQQMRNIFAALVYVPQAWLIKTAPTATEIDWSDINSLKWLRSDKFQALGKAKIDAESSSGPN